MNEPNELRRKLTINGEDYFLAVSQYGSGPPGAGKTGKPGVLYMDTGSNPEQLYICTAASPDTGSYMWKPIETILRVSFDGNATPGNDGITPHIGENGHWYLGETDTGVSAQGDPGDDGGHYTPVVSQPTATTMKVEFKPSKAGMPAVDAVTVELPVGEDSGQNVELDTTLTQSGKAADAKAVGDALDKLEEKIPSIEGLAKEEDIPMKTSELTNDSGYQTAAQVTAIVQRQLGVIEDGTY